jgi:hypothetical protein
LNGWGNWSIAETLNENSTVVIPNITYVQPPPPNPFENSPYQNISAVYKFGANSRYASYGDWNITCEGQLMDSTKKQTYKGVQAW